MSPIRQATLTRLKILETALALFYKGSFAATSINQIVTEAGITKGALFHYFKGKNELGYAVVDELLSSEISEHWIEPLSASVDPATDIATIIRGFAQETEENPNMVTCGCPLNNMSQELSAVDEVFREKFGAIYKKWEKAIEDSIRAGIEAGNVKEDIDPAVFATTFVALLEGSIGLIKVFRSREHMELIGEGIVHLLESTRRV